MKIAGPPGGLETKTAHDFQGTVTVVDIVYHPSPTPLLAAARALGVTAVGGLGMLVHQAGHAFRLWTGQDAPIGAMTAAAEAQLSERRQPPAP